MDTSSGSYSKTAVVFTGLWLLTTLLVTEAGDVNYRDVIIEPNSSYLSRYFRRLYRRQRHCDEPELSDRVRMADIVMTGTIRALEVDPDRPESEIARVEVKRIFKDHDQVCITYCMHADVCSR